VGDPLARDVVLNAYSTSLIQSKARRLCRRPGFSCSEREDLEQEMWLHLVAQAHHFDARRASLNTFIDRTVCSCVAMILRHRRRSKRAPGFGTLSLESTLIEVDGQATPAREAISPDDLHRRTGAGFHSEAVRREEAEAITFALDAMPVGSRDLCRRLMSGTVNSVARDLRLSRRQVCDAIPTIRGHLEQAGFRKNERIADNCLSNGISN
jgi:RNA polymerase sigma-70 factor, ECF subfamily